MQDSSLLEETRSGILKHNMILSSWSIGPCIFQLHENLINMDIYKLPTSDDMALFILLFASYIQEKVRTGGGGRVREGGMHWGEAALSGNVHLPNTSHNTV